MIKRFPALTKRGIGVVLRPWLWSFRPLRKKDLALDPIIEFGKWFKRAKRCFWLEFPDAMCLSTVNQEGCAEGRMVLLKSFDHKGFVFYTNSLSVKGKSLETKPYAALTFYWEALQRQVRIQGPVEKVTAKESDDYFRTRWRTSQIGAWASKQSEVLECREILEDRVREFRQKFKGQIIPRPAHWLGYRVIPEKIEFWKLRPNRLHDRFLYTRQKDGGWKLERLYP